MYQPEQFVKLTNPNGINRGFHYKEGLNEDIYELNIGEECSQGGLYFCQFKDVGKWVIDYEDALIWKVEIPKGEEVIQYEKKYKAKRIIIHDAKNAYEDYEICKLAVQEDGYALRFIKEQTEELCKLAIQQNSWALQFVKEQTEELCKLALKKHCLTLQFVKEQNPELCKLALQQNCCALQYVKEQTEELCKFAVQQNGWAIRYIKPKFKYLF